MLVVHDDRHAAECAFAQVAAGGRCPTVSAVAARPGGRRRTQRSRIAAAAATVPRTARPAPPAAIARQGWSTRRACSRAVQSPTAGASAKSARSGPTIAPAVFAARMAPTAGPPCRARSPSSCIRAGSSSREARSVPAVPLATSTSKMGLVAQELPPSSSRDPWTARTARAAAPSRRRRLPSRATTSARAAIPRWSAARAMAAPPPSPARKTARTVANEYTEFSWISANARVASASSASVIAPETHASASVSRDGAACLDRASTV